MVGTNNLTQVDEENHKLSAQTHDGMASWAGKGPIGKTCFECKYFAAERKTKPKKYQKFSCVKFCEMVKKSKGPTFPGDTLSCRYFEDGGDRWAKTAK